MICCVGGGGYLEGDDKMRTSGLSSRRAREGFNWFWLVSGGRSWDVEWRSTSFGVELTPSVCGMSFCGYRDGMSMFKFCCGIGPTIYAEFLWGG